MDENRSRTQYIGTFIFVCAVVLFSAWIEQSFLFAFVWGGILSITTYPLYRRLVGRGMGNRMAAGLIAAGIFALLAVPMIAMVVRAGMDLPSLLAWGRGALHDGIPVSPQVADIPRIGPRLSALWSRYLSDPEELRHWTSVASRMFATGDGRALPHRVMDMTETFVIATLSVYFYLAASHALVSDIRAVGRRFLGERTGDVMRNTVGAVRGTVAGLVLVGLGQGVLVGIGYFIAGTPHPALLTLLTAVVSIIPFCGPILLCATTLMTFAANGVTQAVIVAALGTIAYGAGDHFVRPKLISGSTSIPFLAVLTAILGGLHMFGLLGLFMGPTVIAVALSLWRTAAAEEQAR
ncbi:AI-2E family transporter [Komagataeibacter oboediens]|uniref:AI-2E family transporter n=1 Tax=Komagataeibacter oboediens TaxID=65958 RepID=A0ABS5SLI6_9PROT|nr:AI-2E family transporter [Komagataeibacter oboediens]MBL7233539.1 AI-2E family transporter [Komagataeibacter oboediens]MBT0675049.1 AI-2E family transporter [Komagataeibacter oboediens]MBT0678414.1 AI-2E family transporter [Komagataeibacter oboediens]MBV0887226.1 AI-2E family transporter [Komagataeibacter oboediens]MBV1822796.1 AI-2E family transporter [Komagataeibacter oboediens]